MTEEIFDRTYRDGRHQLHAGIARGLETARCSLAKTFRLFQAIQFDAPWQPRSRNVGCA